VGYPFAFTADANTLLPLADFIKEVILKKITRKLFERTILVEGSACVSDPLMAALGAGLRQ